MLFRSVILIFFLSFVLNAQSDMQFNRVIDTILVVDVNPGINAASFPIYGTPFSPENGKVWKINNISMRRGGQPSFVSCNTGAIFSSSGMFQVILINDGVNEMPLCSANMSGNNNSNSITYYDQYNCNQIEYPMWMNDSSELIQMINNEYARSEERRVGKDCER